MEGGSDSVDPAPGPSPWEAPRRPARRILVRVLVTTLVVWVVAAGAMTVVGAIGARAGAERVRDLDLTLGVGELIDGDVDDQIEAARRDFATADRFLGSPLLTPARLLPVAGRQLRSAGALSETAADVLGAATSALSALRAEVGDGPPTENDRVESLGRLRSQLRAVERVLADVDLGPGDALVGPLRDARAEVSQKLAETRTRTADVLTIVDGVHELLEGPSRYLVLAANNAEMRVGSAMVLSVGTMDVVDGTVRVADEFEPAGDILLSEPVPLSKELADLWSWSTMGTDYRSLALSARFPVSAQLGAQMWSALGRGDVDGVLLIDVEGIAALLRVAGPVEVDGRPIDADGVVPYLLREQYEGQGLHDMGANDERRDRLRVLAAAALETIGGTDIELRTMLDELGSARDGRHLMAWSSDELAQRAWETVDVDGELDARSLLVGLANFDNSKLDPYVAAAIRGGATRDGDDALVDLAIEVSNEAPEGLPGYVAGADDGSTYRGLLSAHLPSSATDVELAGFDGRAAFGRDGPTLVIAARVDVERQETRTANLRFRIPVSDLDEVTVLPSGRFPATRWQVGGADWLDASPTAWPPHVP